MIETFTPFHLLLLELLPCDVPPQDQERLGTDILIPKIPSKDDIDKITEAANKYIETTLDVNSYILDLSREAQNIFLGDLFSHFIPPRKPIDPKYLVISTAPKEVEKLKKYFLEETEWGKNQKKLKDTIRESIENCNHP